MPISVYVARQPILDIANETHGYELLYRSSDQQTQFPKDFDGDQATCTLLSDTLTAFGVGNLTNHGLAFVNFTRNLILGDLLNLLDPKTFIIEILENTVIDTQLLNRLNHWHHQGYVFALDDYIGGDEIWPMVPYLTIVKVDFLQVTTAKKRQEIARKLLPYNLVLLAEKIETQEDYEQARSMGYTLFQGYYFQRPMIVRTDLPEVQNITCIRAFNEITKPDLNFDRLESIVLTDIALTYKLLKYIGTLRYYRGYSITTVKAALVRMGIDDLRSWLMLIFIREVTDSSSAEQIKSALVRGIFAQNTIIQMGLTGLKNDAFLTGLFSMLTTIMEKDMHELIDNVCLPDEVREALLYHAGVLYEVLTFASDFQQGNWDRAMGFIHQKNLDDKQVVENYFLAVQYADQCFIQNMI